MLSIPLSLLSLRARSIPLLPYTFKCLILKFKPSRQDSSFLEKTSNDNNEKTKKQTSWDIFSILVGEIGDWNSGEQGPRERMGGGGWKAREK